MSVDNVYLSIVNDSGAIKHLRAVMVQRIKYSHGQFRYYAPVVKTLSAKAGVINDWMILTQDECKQVWKLVIDYVYGDELAGLNPCQEIVLPTNNETKETIMSVTTKTIHTVNGTDVQALPADDLIRCIKDVEQEIKELKAINIQSKYVLKKIEELQATLVVVVGHLDAK
jgi:hypothetical protein